MPSSDETQPMPRATEGASVPQADAPGAVPPDPAPASGSAWVPGPAVPGMAWLPVAPPHLRRPTPWWVALVAVLSGLLLLGIGMAVGFGMGYVVGDHASDHSEIGGVPGNRSQGWSDDRQQGRTDENGVPGGLGVNPGNRDGDVGHPGGSQNGSQNGGQNGGQNGSGLGPQSGASSNGA